MRSLAIVLLSAGALADWYLTKRALFDKRGFRERNKPIRMLIKALNPKEAEWTLLGLKVAMVVLIALSYPPMWVLWLFAVLQALVALWNKRTIERSKR